MLLLAVIGGNHSAHMYPVSCLPQAGFTQGNKQPNIINNSIHCSRNKQQQTHTALATEQKCNEAVCPEIGTLFNWMQSLMKEENAGRVILNNASTDWAPTSWW